MFFKRKKPNRIDNKRYILNVITKHDDGGYSSHWYGWSSQWLFTYDECLKIKAKIQDFYDDIEIIEFSAQSYLI